jgi:hypothetical protein
MRAACLQISPRGALREGLLGFACTDSPDQSVAFHLQTKVASCSAGEHNAATTTLPPALHAGLSVLPSPSGLRAARVPFQLGFERFSPIQHDLYVTNPQKRDLSPNARMTRC